MKKSVPLSEVVARIPDGAWTGPKIVRQCSLPITSIRRVRRCRLEVVARDQVSDARGAALALRLDAHADGDLHVVGGWHLDLCSVARPRMRQPTRTGAGKRTFPMP